MPLPGYGNSQVDPGLLGGVNSMQSGAGLMPGGLPQPGGFQTPMGFPPPYVMPMAPAMFGSGVSPYPRPMGMFSPPGMNFGSAFGSDQRMQQQRMLGHGYQMGSYAQTGMGVAARVGGGMAAWSGGSAMGAAIGSAVMPGIGTAVGGFIGGMAGSMGFESSGLGDFAQRAGEGVMAPFHQATMRAAQLQNSSMSYVRSGGDLGMGGAGLSMGAARTTQHQLMGVADSRQFQRETGARFNRQDVMRISQLAGEMGMLDQAQTATEITQHITKISKALANIMKIAGEPDIKNAMRMMGQLRMTGMNIGEQQTAVMNAKTFARMAGVSVSDAISGGMAGMGMFQQQGMTGAAGLNAGMAAMGMAGMAAGALSPRQMALMGGREGIQQNITSGAAAAGSLDPVMMSMLTRRNGQLAVDPNRLLGMISGKTGLGQSIGQTAVNFNDPNAIQEFSYRRGELRDQMQRMMGPQASVLLPMIQAIQVARSVPGMSLGAAFRTLGMDEQQANTFQTLARSREFWSGMRQQIDQNREQMQRDRAHSHEMTRDAAASQPLIFGEQRRTLGRGLSNLSDGFNRWRRNNAEEDDAEANATSLGGDKGVLRMAHSERFSSDVGNARARDALRGTGGSDVFTGALGMGMGRSRMDASNGFRGFEGPDGYGLSQASRGGLSNLGLVRKQMDFSEQWAYAFGNKGPASSAATADKYMQDTIAVAGSIEKAFSASAADRATHQNAAQTKLGVKQSTFDSFTSRAAALIIRKAADKYTLMGKNDKFTPAELEEHILKAARDSGINTKDPAIRAKLLSAEMKQTILNSAVMSGDAKSRTVLQELQQRGGEGSERNRIDDISVTRETADTTRLNAAASLGVRGGLFAGPSEESVKALSEIISGPTGKDDQGKLTRGRQQLLSAMADEQAANEKGGAEGQTLRESAIKKRAALAREFGSKLGNIESEVNKSLSSLNDNKRKELLSNIAGSSAGQLAAAGRQMTQASISSQFYGGLEQSVGSRGVRAFEKAFSTSKDLKAAYGAATEFAGDSEKELFAAASRGDKKAMDQLRGRMLDKGKTGLQSVGGEGLSPGQSKETELEKTINEIQSSAQKLGTDQFTVSVGKFSEASDALLKAAEKLQDSSVLGALGNVVNSGNTAVGWVENKLGFGS